MRVINFHQYGSVAALNETFGDRWLYIGRRNKRCNRYSHNPLANVQAVCANRIEAVTKYAVWLNQQVATGNTAVCQELAQLHGRSVLGGNGGW